MPDVSEYWNSLRDPDHRVFEAYLLKQKIAESECYIDELHDKMYTCTNDSDSIDYSEELQAEEFILESLNEELDNLLSEMECEYD